MNHTLKKILTMSFFLVMYSSTTFSQLSFVELRKEISCFDNTRCVNQDFNISLPYFDLPEKGTVLRQLNDSLYALAGMVLSDMNKDLQFKSKSWEADKTGIDSCYNGINSTETRDLYYSILYNENNLLSFIIRNDWTVEKQMILKSDFISAQQQLVYCFSVDLEKDKLIDVNTLFKAQDYPKIIEMIRSEYEIEYEEEIAKAGDRLRFCGFLFTPVNLVAVYNMLLPQNQSEVRTIDIPLNQVYDYLDVRFQQVFKHEVKE